MHPVSRKEWVTPLLVTELHRRFQKKRVWHFPGSTSSIISQQLGDGCLSEFRNAPFSVMQAMTCTVKGPLFMKTYAGLIVAVREE